MKSLRAPIRDLHLYAGLFLSPFLLVFAVSTLVLNHPARSANAAATTTRKDIAVDVRGDVGSVEHARAILEQLGVTGEIDYVRHNAKAGRLFIPVAKPGEATKVDVDLRAQRATVERQERGLADALVYLHKMPGPHNVKFRGNWVYLTWWGVTADVVVYGLLFLTLSGVYLWWALKSERAIGWLLLGGGAASVGLLVSAIVTA